MHNLESLLEQVKELPSLPEIYIRVSELLDNDDSTAMQIGETVQTDPSITSRILKMVNSAYYGLPHRVSTISQAVSLLGRQRLKQMLMGSVLEGLFRNIGNSDFPMQEFWQHSIKTAIIARHLAMQNAHIIDHDSLFTAGLLHDIGRLVMEGGIPGHATNVENLMKSKRIGIVEAETELFGFAHTEVSEALLQKWGLPELLVHCVRNHHEESHEGPSANETCIVYLANQLSHNLPAIDEDDAQNILDGIPNWQQTRCTVEQTCIAWQLAEDQVFEVMDSFGMVNIDIRDD